jgi:glyoxylase-like metal-dependent hydrolase (beta-lactamase superfamily II)
MSSPLQWNVFVSDEVPVVTRDLPPGVSERRWSPISSTLISGQREALLVDTFITVEQNRKLADWIVKTGKVLTTIYATHGHGDHFFGVNTIRERFPNARFVALPQVITVMRQQASSAVLDSFWNPRFPGQIDANPAIAEQVEGTVVELEGQELVSVPLGHTDTDNTTCLHVPSIGLVVAGDAAYNDVHVYLAESNADTRKEWISALDTIESLKPLTVVAGHKRPGRADAPSVITETRQYIRDFDRIAADTRTAKDLYNEMFALYPDRVNPGALWSSARGVKG